MNITTYRRRITGALVLLVLAGGLTAAGPASAAPRAVLGELFSADN
jgi:hypothetical protein